MTFECSKLSMRSIVNDHKRGRRKLGYIYAPGKVRPLTEMDTYLHKNLKNKQWQAMFGQSLGVILRRMYDWSLSGHCKNTDHDPNHQQRSCSLINPINTLINHVNQQKSSPDHSTGSDCYNQPSVLCKTYKNRKQWQKYDAKEHYSVIKQPRLLAKPISLCIPIWHIINSKTCNENYYI